MQDRLTLPVFLAAHLIFLLRNLFYVRFVNYLASPNEEYYLPVIYDIEYLILLSKRAN